MRKRIYIAGPISHGDVRDNVARATKVGRELIRRGFAPLVPQLSCFMAYWTSRHRDDAPADLNNGPPWVQPQPAPGGIPHEDWLAADLPWVAQADAVLRLAGPSKGADQETQLAEELGIPVFQGATDDLGVGAVVAHFAAEPPAKEPFEATITGQWVWFVEGKFDGDDPNTLPRDVFAKLTRHDRGSVEEGGKSYRSRDEAVAAYQRVACDEPEHRTFSTGSVRDKREDKGRFDLLPPVAIHRLAQHFERGAAKYGDRNWEKGQPLQSYLNSALRHVFNFQLGLRDEDHLIAAVWNLMAYVETQHRIDAGALPAELDDFPWATEEDGD